MMKVGIQLYSVRNNMMANPLEALRKVIKTGYRNLEIANHVADKDFGVGFGVSAKEISAILKEENAQIISGHIGPMTDDNIDAILEYHNEIGTKFICIPMDFYTGRDDVLKKTEYFNKLGKKINEAGLELLYHNHFHEFQSFDGDEVYDLIINNTDPNYLKFEIDTYWLLRGGQNPVDIMKSLKNRIRLVHQKDFPKGFENELNLIDEVRRTNPLVDMNYFMNIASPTHFTEIGTGIINIQEIIDAANTYCGVEYIVLEQDFSSHEEMESIKISMDSFKKFTGIEW